MKHLLRNTIIIALYLTGVTALRRKWLERRWGGLVRVITFHEIKPQYEKHFLSTLHFLKQQYNLLTPQDFYSRQWPLGKTNVLLTFDDGYRSWMSNVVPLMKRMDLSGIFFIPSGFINAGRGGDQFYSSKSLRIKETRAMNWDDVRELNAPGFEIGGHTVSHPNLASLSASEMMNEIKGDKTIIEDELGRKLVSFAYPFGDKARINEEVFAAARASGYSFAFTTLPGFNSAATDPYVLHRDCLEPYFGKLLLQAWIAGGYDIVRKLKP